MGDSAEAMPLGSAAARPATNPWLIAVVVAMAAFMEVLDTSIANVALPHIAGNLGVTNDESTWVLTSYLVSNAIVLPISGWIAGAIGRKRFFMMCIVFFTLSSLLCGIAPSLGMLILFRVMQGAGGGGLQPMAQAILADTFPPQQRGLAFGLYGITAVMAPTIGPTLGGWITDNYTWRWIFFINLPVGILALFLIYSLVQDPPYAKRAARAGVKIDYIGIALLTLGVGALQIMLDKGQEDDWFGSHFIVTLAITAFVCLVSLGIWEWFHKDPIIEVRLFKNFNFLASNGMMFFLGVIYFSSLVMLPLFLQTLLGYTATSSGLVLSASGFVLLFELPLVGKLTTIFPAKYLTSLGWLIMSLSMFYTVSHLDTEISFNFASGLRVFQGVGLGFLFVPITLAAYVGLPAEKSNSISGIINFMRNMGSSVGTSMVTTLLAQRAQVHQAYLVAHVTRGQPAFARTAQSLARYFAAAGTDSWTAQRRAYGLLYQELIGQATTLAYIDTFMVLGVAAAIMFLLSFLLRKNDPGGGGEAAAG
ncbi:MAG: DHA2 family efflux MFS transporter permease subunit [Candidatus Acidiferrales bacterium]